MHYMCFDACRNDLQLLPKGKRLARVSSKIVLDLKSVCSV